MNRGDNNHLDADLERVGKAYRALGAEEPPALVDQAVLNRARAAVDTPRRAWSFNLTWVHGLATAGVAVLALTLFMELREIPPQPPEPAFRVNLEKSAADPDDALAAPTEGEELQRKLRAAPKKPAAVDRPAAPEYDFAEPAAEATSEAARNEPAALEDRRDALQDAAPAQQQSLGQSAASSLDEVAPAAVGDAGANREQAAELNQQAGRESRAKREVGDDVTAGERQRRAAEESAAAAPPAADLAEEALLAPMSTMAVLEPAARPCTEDGAGCSAEQWFMQLSALREAGDEARFKESLAAFRATFPDFELPQDWPE